MHLNDDLLFWDLVDNYSSSQSLCRYELIRRLSPIDDEIYTKIIEMTWKIPSLHRVLKVSSEHSSNKEVKERAHDLYSFKLFN